MNTESIIDKERKRRVFTQNRNVIFNTALPTDDNVRKQRNVARKNYALESKDTTRDIHKFH